MVVSGDLVEVVEEEPLCVAGIFSAKYKGDALSVKLLKVNGDIDSTFSFSFSVLLIGKFHILHSVLIGDGPSFIIDNRGNVLVLKIFLQLLHQQNWMIITVKHVPFLARKFEIVKIFDDGLVEFS